jgi:hypothetical protein
MRPSRFLTVFLAIVFSGCAAQLPAASSAPGTVGATSTAPRHARLSDNMLIFLTDGGELRYWPIDRKGGRTSYSIGTVTGVSDPTAMAANGNTIAISAGNPPSVVLYDVTTGTQASLPDKKGNPVDLAYDKQGNIVVLNGNRDVVVYKAPQFSPKLLQCSLLLSSFASYIAANREGDIFINQQIDSDSNVIEIPKGPRGYEPGKCSQLPIQEEGYAAGLLVDPKTDALVVFHEPDQCAGGNEAEMDVYGKPYGKGSTIRKNLNGNCAYMLRFGPDAEHVYFIDGSPTLRARHGGPNDSGIHVDQRDYPSGAGNGEYRNPRFSAGVATIPNELPN